MSAPQQTPPDAAAMAGVLREAAELCRRLDLPKEAALFEGFVARLSKEQPTSNALRDEAYHALNGPAGLSAFPGSAVRGVKRQDYLLEIT